MIGNQNTIKIGQAVISIVEEHTEAMVFPRERFFCKDSKAVDEPQFARAYIDCNGGFEKHGTILYGRDGPVDMGEMDCEIDELLEELGHKTQVAAKRKSIRALIESFSYVAGPWDYPKTILPFQDGDLDISDPDRWVFRSGHKTVMPYRFPVKFPTADTDCPQWKEFLTGLFASSDDVRTFHMFLASCLTPCTDNQSMLWLYGSAGAGKSQIWCPIRAIWGVKGYYTTNFAKLDNEFAIESFHYSLIVGDDDVSEKGLASTETLKKLITGQVLERNGKHIQHDQVYDPPYHLIALSNFPPYAKEDDTSGFSRRVYPIRVRTRTEPYATGKSIGKEIVNAELEGIVCWLLKGLYAWLKNGRKIPLSEQTKLNQRSIIEERDSLHKFAYQCLRKNPNGRVTTEDMFRAYYEYCKDNELEVVGNLYYGNDKAVSKFGTLIKPILERLGGVAKDKVPTKEDATKRKCGWIGFEL